MTSLVFGLIFLGVVGLWALRQSDWVDLPGLSVLGPALLVVAGFVGLAATLGASSRSRRREEQRAAERASEQPADVPAPAAQDDEADQQHDRPLL